MAITVQHKQSFITCSILATHQYYHGYVVKIPASNCVIYAIQMFSLFKWFFRCLAEIGSDNQGSTVHCYKPFCRYVLITSTNTAACNQAHKCVHMHWYNAWHAIISKLISFLLTFLHLFLPNIASTFGYLLIK